MPRLVTVREAEATGDVTNTGYKPDRCSSVSHQLISLVLAHNPEKKSSRVGAVNIES